MSFFNALKGMSLMEILTQFVLPYGIKIVLAIVIYVLGRKFVNWLSKIVVKASFRASKDQILADFLGTIFGFVGFLLVVMFSLSQVGVDTTSFVAILGAAGLAVGLSLQDSLANFASGIIMLVFKPFRKDDFIEAAGVMGSVEEMGILLLRLKTADNKSVLVPNSNVFSSSIINYSRHDTRRIDLELDISYESSIKKAKEVVEACFKQERRLLSDMGFTIVLGEMAESSIRLYARCWVKTYDFWSVKWSLLENIKEAFDQEGIEIPYNKLDLNVINKPVVDTE